jgi:type IV pilus assembly protein PilE
MHLIRTARGITLVELLVVMAVLGIIASVAYPSYRGQVMRSHRAAAQAFLMDVSLRQQQRLVDVRSYAADLDELGMSAPESVARHYTITIDAGDDLPPAFTLSAAPIGAQVNDKCETLLVDSAGRKGPAGCW